MFVCVYCRKEAPHVIRWLLLEDLWRSLVTKKRSHNLSAAAGGRTHPRVSSAQKNPPPLRPSAPHAGRRPPNPPQSRRGKFLKSETRRRKRRRRRIPKKMKSLMFTGVSTSYDRRLLCAGAQEGSIRSTTTTANCPSLASHTRAANSPRLFSPATRKEEEEIRLQCRQLPHRYLCTSHK